MSALSLSLFGRFQAILNGAPLAGFRTIKVQALLIYLAAEPPMPHRRESLMTLLWPGMPERSARQNLRQIIYNLRRAIPELPQKGIDGEIAGDTAVPLLLANRHTIQLNPLADVSSDVGRFDALIERTRTHDHLDILLCHDCRQDLEAAVALYKGDFLADFYLDDSNAYEEWAEVKRQGYRRQALDALETLTTIATREAAYIEARGYAERQLEIDDLRESAYRQLMKILALNGQRAEALALYETLERQLAEELGMAPAARTTERYEQIRAGDMSFSATGAREVRGLELKEKIGEGTYGAVHRAVQPTVGREVAVKVIRRRYADDPEFIRRFEAEARVIARLEHPYIVPLYDYWRDPQGAYLVMRLLRGGNLLTSLQSGPWDIEPTLKMVDQITSALASAHCQGVIHRDIKPANILLDEACNAYLSDFGIAKQLAGDIHLTAAGAIMGTPDYISPEQLRDEPLGPPSDIYSLGAVLYETLTGERPFPDMPVALLIQKQLEEPIPPLSASRPDLPRSIDAVIQRATAKRPDDRYDNALAFAQALRQAVGNRDGARPPIAVDAAVPAAVDVVNPYKGLRAFQESDAADFFGRESLVQRLLSRLCDSRFVAVVGPSGSGKSSLVKAGLIPALRQGAIPGSETWFVAEMVPGEHPLEELELALLPIAVDPPPSLLEPLQKDERGLLRTLRRIIPGAGETQLLLLIDQFEELFTLVADDDRRRHFLDNLLVALKDPRSPLRLVITLRADFYDRPLQVQPFADLFKQQTEIVLPLKREELTWAIREPARRLGVGIEESVVTAMVTDVVDQPGALPLLQYALTELFDERHDRMMTLAAYQSLGGVSGALAQRAEEIYAGFDEAQREAARQLFLRLVTLGEGIEDTRRRVLREELERISLQSTVNSEQSTVNSSESGVQSRQSTINDQQSTINNQSDIRHPDDSALRAPHSAFDSIRHPTSDIPNVIDLFGQYRLLTFDHDPLTRGPTVEVAHEALLREWDRLRYWLDESRADVRLQRLLAVETAEWQKHGRDNGYLLRSARLDQFAGWLEQSSVSLTDSEQAFLAASIAARESRSAAEESRRQRELETAQQLAETQKQRAEEQAQSAGRLRRRALVLAGALAIAAILAIVAIFFARQSSAERLNAETQTALLLAQQAENELQNGYYDRAVLLALEALEDFPYNSQAERALGNAVSYNRALQLCPGHASAATGVAWSPDGSRIASIASTANQVLVWDAATCRELLAIDLPRGITGNKLDMGLSVEWTPDGANLLTMTGDRYLVGSQDYDLIIWDGQTGEQITAVEIPNHAEAEVPEATSSGTHYSTGSAVDFAPGSGILATIGGDNTAIIWDESAQYPALILTGHENDVNSVAWSPDGKRLATASLDGTARIWDGQTAEELLRLQEHEDRVNQAAWSPDGERLATGGFDGKACIWDADGGDLLQCLDAHAGSVWSLAWLADNVRLATGHEDAAIRIWDSRTGELQQTLRGHESLISHLDRSPLDDRLVSSGGSGQVRVWNVAASTAEQALPYKSLNGYLDITDDGQYVALPVGDNFYLTAEPLLVIWDLETELPIVEGLAPDFGLYTLSVKYSPDETMLLAIGTHEFPDFSPLTTAYVFDSQNGDLLRTFTIDDENYLRSIAWSPDGSQIAAGRFFYGEILVWDFQSGEIIAQLPADNDTEFNMVNSLQWSPDGSKLAAAYDDNTVRVWDALRWELLFKMEHEAPASCWDVQWSPDGNRLLTTAGNDETGAQDTTARIWDGQTGRELLVMQGHTRQIASAAWSPNGKRVATISGDGTTHLWDAGYGDELLNLSTPNLFIGYLGWSGDGQHLVIGGHDLPASVWRVWQSTEELVAYAQECCVFRDLTADEREQFGLGDG